MATTNRASLLNGLRTGGVRSSSMSAPLSPAPAASFHLPRFASPAVINPAFPEEDGMDQLSGLLSNNLYINSHATQSFAPTIDHANTAFIQQQAAAHKPLNPNSVPFSPAHLQQQTPSADAQLNAYHQMQLMQLEILRLQNAQAQRNQQVQAAVLAEALRQQARRSPLGFVPASAGPVTTSFDLRSNTPPTRRPNQAELLKAQLGVASISQQDDHVPMTAALGGRFGARLPPSTIAFPSFPDAGSQGSSPPKQTHVLVGGLVRGGSPPHQASRENTPSRSDAATSWRRGNTHSAFNGLRATSNASPSVKITPPPEERTSSLAPASKLRPRPLSFTSMAASNIPIVAIDSGSEHEDAMSSASSTSQSNPATPQSLTSLEASPLSPREEATKKLYDGLGMGRPVPYVVQAPAMLQRLASQPVRQPRGPPSGADELGPKNFATRIRRKAIGGLGVLMDARERRESIEVY